MNRLYEFFTRSITLGKKREPITHIIKGRDALLIKLLNEKERSSWSVVDKHVMWDTIKEICDIDPTESWELFCYAGYVKVVEIIKKD